MCWSLRACALLAQSTDPAAPLHVWTYHGCHGERDKPGGRAAPPLARHQESVYVVALHDAKKTKDTSWLCRCNAYAAAVCFFDSVTARTTTHTNKHQLSTALSLADPSSPSRAARCAVAGASARSATGRGSDCPHGLLNVGLALSETLLSRSRPPLSLVQKLADYL